MDDENLELRSNSSKAKKIKLTIARSALRSYLEEFNLLYVNGDKTTPIRPEMEMILGNHSITELSEWAQMCALGEKKSLQKRKLESITSEPDADGRTRVTQHCATNGRAYGWVCRAYPLCSFKLDILKNKKVGWRVSGFQPDHINCRRGTSSRRN